VSPDLTMALRLLLAAVLGAVIGFQRERTGKPAGLRTHMLICIGSALFTLVSVYAFSGVVDPSRVAACVVTGIGFIGAGAIIFRTADGYIA
jgi:putative Mg2+ transporter-C (MgtC) family protein